MKTLERLLGIAAGLALFGMMALTFVDVVGRKLFETSVTGSVELTELLMLGVIFIALPLTSLRGEHVIFDLLDPVLPRPLKRLQHTFANLVCVALLAGSAWLVLLRAARTADQGDTTAQLLLPLAPFQFVAGAMLLVTALMHLVLAFRAAPDSDAFHAPTIGGVDD